MGVKFMLRRKTGAGRQRNYKLHTNISSLGFGAWKREDDFKN